MRVDGNVAFLPLGKGRGAKRKFALVDLEDADRVFAHRWFAQPSGLTWYVRASSSLMLPVHHMGLHAYILRAHKGQRIDHVNGDGLDNRKENLRFASGKENARNCYKTVSSHVTSKFKGVSLTSSGRWLAQISIDGTPNIIGLFDLESEAAHAYDAEATRCFGEFAKTNERMGLFGKDVPNRTVGASKHSGNKVGPRKPAWQAYLDGDGALKQTLAIRDAREERRARKVEFDVKVARQAGE